MLQFPPSPKTTHARPSSVLPCRFPAAGAKTRFQNKNIWLSSHHFKHEQIRIQLDHGFYPATTTDRNQSWLSSHHQSRTKSWLSSHHSIHRDMAMAVQPPPRNIDNPEPTHASPPCCSSALSFHRPAAQGTPGR